MKIRRYFGKNTQEAMLKVKMDLGNEAIILNTRKVRQKGLFKIFANPVVEILAAIDEYASAKHDIKTQSNESKESTRTEEIENKVNDMEHLIKKMYARMEADNEEKNKVNTHFKQKGSIKGENLIKDELKQILLHSDVDEAVADTLLNETEKNIKADKNSKEEWIKSLSIELKKVLGSPETIQLRDDGKPTVVMFIGPTGVGKTTTLAKLAASYSLNYHKSVGLITTDTYRISAVEQLKTYAEILGLPLSIVYSINEIKEMIIGFSDKDLILIDTAGRSHKDKKNFEEIISWVKASEADEVYLVLSMTTSNKTLHEIIANYSFHTKYKLILTKLDEVSTVGLIVNTCKLTEKKLSFITTGQNVPDDIEIVHTDIIIEKLMGSIKL